MDSPPAAKRRRIEEEVTPSASSRGKRPTSWITPSFGEPDTTKSITPQLKPFSKMTAFKAPSFHAAGSSVPTALTTPKKPLQPLSNPSRRFKPPDSPFYSNAAVAGPSLPSPRVQASPLLHSTFISSLSDQFKLPKSASSTPSKDLKPLGYPPPPPSNPPRIASGSQRVALFNSKPLTKTPLTTRLAAITTTPSKLTLKSESDDTSSDDLTAIDLDAQSRRSIIANQAREHLIKMETDDGGAASGYWSNSAAMARSEEDDARAAESMRGMAISPEKPDRARKRRGFVRNGLAERASHLISRSQQEFLLWSHDVGRTLVHSAPASRTPPHDLRVSVLEVLTAPFKETTDALLSHSPFPPLPPPYALARCKVTSKAGFEAHGRDVKTVLILFAYSTVTATSTAAAASRLSSMIGLEKGREVLLWRPWSEVEMPPEPGGNASSSDKPPTLLCTRFLVTPRPKHVS